ncbi:unnamed protein product, partial [Ectocarpus sp. 13 AM-2016]
SPFFFHDHTVFVPSISRLSLPQPILFFRRQRTIVALLKRYLFLFVAKSRTKKVGIYKKKRREDFQAVRRVEVHKKKKSRKKQQAVLDHPHHVFPPTPIRTYTVLLVLEPTQETRPVYSSPYHPPAIERKRRREQNKRAHPCASSDRCEMTRARNGTEEPTKVVTDQ